MQKIDYDNRFPFSAPWTQVGEYAANLETELRREVVAGHPLHLLDARAIAQRIDTDDVLFEVDSPNFRYATVRLSWTGGPERDPRWPHTDLFATFQSWAEGRMKPDSRQSSEP